MGITMLGSRSLLSLLFLLVISSTGALAQDGTRSISVIGTGEVDVVPDQVIINYGVETMHNDIRQAVAENKDRVRQLIESLKGSGIPAADMQTNQLNIYPRWDWREGDQRFLGYTVSRNVQVTISDLDRFDDILVKAIEAGANQVFQASFKTSSRSELEAEARTRAVADARQKAEAIADQLGVRLGPAISVREVVSGGNMPVYQREMAMEESAMAPGRTSVTARLEVEFQML